MPDGRKTLSVSRNGEDSLVEMKAPEYKSPMKLTARLDGGILHIQGGLLDKATIAYEEKSERLIFTLDNSQAV